MSTAETARQNVTLADREADSPLYLGNDALSARTGTLEDSVQLPISEIRIQLRIPDALDLASTPKSIRSRIQNCCT